MTFNSTGTYTPASGATTATSGAVIQSAVWNAIFEDLSDALTQVMQQMINTISVQRNILFGNGGFEIWQRGAGSSSSIAVAASTTSYTADRWYLATGANQASVVAAVTGITDQSQLAGKVTRNSGQTGTGVMTFGYPLDTDSIVAMRGQKVSLTCSVKAGANWSPTSGTLSYALYVGTGSVAKRGAGFTSETTILTGSTNLTVSGQTTITLDGSVTVPLTSTQAEFQFTWTPTGTAGVDDSVTIDDVQLVCQNTTDTYTDIIFDRVPYSVMIDDCQAHFQKTFQYGTAPAQTGGYNGALAVIAQATTKQAIYWRFPREMRTTPTLTTYNPEGASANWQDATSGASLAVSVTATSTKGIFILSATASAVNDTIYIQAQADAGI